MVQLATILTTFALSIAAVQAVPALAPRLSVDPSGAKNVGNGAGGQFITGQCLSNADCASGCCATLPQGGTTIGICSGPAVGNAQGKQGCGFSSSGGGGGGGANNGNKNQNPTPAPTPAPTSPPNNVVVPIEAPVGLDIIDSGLTPDPNGAKNVGNGAGGQFITGGCNSDADCASGCCAVVNTGAKFFGICSGPLANFQNGKQGCGFPVGGGAGTKSVQ